MQGAARFWRCAGKIDAEAKTLRIERSVDDTDKHGLRIKGPKTERGKRTITIDDAGDNPQVSFALAIKSVPDGVSVDLSLVKLPAGALIFPSPGADLTKLRHPRAITKEFAHRAKRLGFPDLRFHDLRGTHETLLLDAGVPIHTVAARCGHDIPQSCCGAMPSAPARHISAAAVIGAFPRVRSHDRIVITGTLGEQIR